MLVGNIRPSCTQPAPARPSSSQSPTTPPPPQAQVAQVAAVQGDDGQGAELLLHHVTLVAPAGADLPHLPDDILHLPLPHEAQVDAGRCWSGC